MSLLCNDYTKSVRNDNTLNCQAGQSAAVVGLNHVYTICSLKVLVWFEQSMSELKQAESLGLADQKPQTHPLTTSQRLKRTLQEYEQSILQQPAAAEEDVLEEALPAQVQNSKQVCLDCYRHASALALCMHTSSIHSVSFVLYPV